jgi:hypothetical protein
MSHQTEAACLLETGSLYRERVLLQPKQGPPIFAGIKHGAFSLYFGDDPFYHVDLDGRWQRTFDDDVHYLKGLDTTVQAIERTREGPNLVLRRRTLSADETVERDAFVRSRAIDLLEGLSSERLTRLSPPPDKARTLADDDLRTMLDRIAQWDATSWLAQRDRYRAAYGPLPFLPPDAANALVLQASVGHAKGVSFGLAAPVEHSTRTAEEFAGHLRDVTALLGRRAAQYKAVFLGGSDVFARAFVDLEAIFRLIADAFPFVERGERRSSEVSNEGIQLDGVHVFVDDPGSIRIDQDQWRRLAELGLRRVSLGLESGNAAIRSIYGKDWPNEILAERVNQMKSAEIGVGILTLVDAGGIEGSSIHLDATAALINSLPLGPGDLVSLLDGNEVRDPMTEPGFTPLIGDSWSEHQAALRQRLMPVRSVRGAKVVPYSLEKQAGHFSST